MKRSRIALSILILVLTFGLFIYYLATHPSTVDQLKSLSPVVVVPLLILYLAFTFFLSLVTRASVELCGKVISHMESFKLTASSAIANFFGPLQSGPGVRALYLKKQHGIPIKKYGLATLYYYGFYAVISGIFLISASQKWRLPLFAVLTIGSICLFYILLKKRRRLEKSGTKLLLGPLPKLAAFTLLQLLCMVLIYAVELTAIGAQVSFVQVLSYTGAANFSLFVSLTPGAIGFREAFLVFSQNLHHISNNDIIAANVLDRAVYVVFLALIFIWLAATHTKKQIDLSKLKSAEPQVPDNN